MISFSAGQLFLVTGASSGIGAATALLLSSLGASVAAVARNGEKLLNVKNSAANPDRFYTFARDLVQDLDTTDEFVRAIVKEHGKLSGFCSCAGVMYMDSLRSFDWEKSAAAMLLHCVAPIKLAEAVADRRNCAGAGTSLVFVSALGAVYPQAGLLSYGAAKGGLLTAAKAMSKEVGKRKIRVNCVSPALVRTPMTVNDYSGLMGYDVLEAEAPNFPLGIGEPRDVASACVFLLSDQARWISGQNLILDGGRY